MTEVRREARPVTPGEALREDILDGLGVTQDRLASAMRVSRLTVNEILNAKRALTAEMALRLSHVLGTDPDYWLNLQRDLDLFRARGKLADELESLEIIRQSVGRDDVLRRSLG